MPHNAESSLAPLLANKGASSPASSMVSSSLRTAKRKRNRDDDNALAINKPAKRKKSKSTKCDNDENLDLESGLNLAVGKFDNRLLADFVAQRTKRFSPSLSLVELEDLYIPEKAFHDTSGWTEPRNLTNLPSFLTHYSSRGTRNKTFSSAASNKNGAPHTLVVTSAGLRAADLTRALRSFQTKGAAVAKLFAKHIKLRDAIEYVKRTRMGIGVGTPSRIIDLVEAEALDTSKIECIIVDCSHIDQKKRGILDIPETQQPLMHLLSRPEFKSRYGQGSGGIQLMMY